MTCPGLPVPGKPSRVLPAGPRLQGRLPPTVHEVLPLTETMARLLSTTGPAAVCSVSVALSNCSVSPKVSACAMVMSQLMLCEMEVLHVSSPLQALLSVQSASLPHPRAC